MSSPSPRRPPRDAEPSQAPASSSVSGGTVSGIPIMPIYAPPLGHNYGVQQQFPPALPPASYYQYGATGFEYKPNYPHPLQPNQPPSIYYSRYPPPSYYRAPLTPQGTPPPPIVTHTAGGATRQLPVSYNSGRVYTTTFDEGHIRNGFVKRVLTLILCQLAISTSLSAVFLENGAIQETIESHPWLLWIGIVTCIAVVVLAKLKPEMARKPHPERYLFALWTLGIVITLAFITALAELKFLLIVQLLIVILLASLIFVSAVQRTALVTGRSLFVTGFALLIAAISLAAFYTNTSGLVFFAVFVSLLVSMFFLFRVHYLMGDEWRKLEPHEVFTGAMSIFF